MDRPDNHPWYGREVVKTKSFQVFVSVSQTVEAEDLDHAYELAEGRIGSDWTIDDIEITNL